MFVPAGNMLSARTFFGLIQILFGLAIIVFWRQIGKFSANLQEGFYANIFAKEWVVKVFQYAFLFAGLALSIFGVLFVLGWINLK